MYRLIFVLSFIATSNAYPPTPVEFRGLWCVSQWSNTQQNYSQQLGQAFFYNNGTFTLNFLTQPKYTWINYFVDIHQMGGEGTYHILTDTTQGPTNYLNRTSCFWRRRISNGDILWGRQSNGSCTPTFEVDTSDQSTVYTRNAPNCQYINDESPYEILSNTSFERELIQFDQSIKESQEESIVFYGSSSIRLWSTLETDFANTQLKIINRGFGGSTLEECSQQFKRVLLPLEPRLLILYAGENDLSARQTPAAVQSIFGQFIPYIRRFFPVLPIVFISIKPSPRRVKLLGQVNLTNHLIKTDIQTMQNVHYIDIFDRMLTTNHTPQSDLYLSDNLHMNERGYAIWTQAIQDYLRTNRFVSKGLNNCELSFVVFALNLLIFFLG